MLNNIKNELLTQTDSLLEYLDSLNLEPSTPFTEAEVQSIIAAETAQTQANYDRAVSQFQESNADSRPEFRHCAHPRDSPDADAQPHPEYRKSRAALAVVYQCLGKQ